MAPAVQQSSSGHTLYSFWHCADALGRSLADGRRARRTIINIRHAAIEFVFVYKKFGEFSEFAEFGACGHDAPHEYGRERAAFLSGVHLYICVRRGIISVCECASARAGRAGPRRADDRNNALRYFALCIHCTALSDIVLERHQTALSQTTLHCPNSE